VTHFKALHIPKRDRKKGEYIFCCKCNTTVTTHCKSSGGRLFNCKSPEAHLFQSRIYDKEKKRIVPLKTYPKELRDYSEFTQLHSVYTRAFVPGGAKPLSIKRPTLLTDALKKYYDWLNDADLPSHMKKNLAEKHIANQLNNLLSFKESQPNYNSLKVIDVNDTHVGVFHDFLIAKEYAPKTYNNKMFSLRQAFNYFINELDYKIARNPFKKVIPKATVAKKGFIQINDFRTLLTTVTPFAGIKLEKCKDRTKRVSLFRDWLTLYWELALYTGGRREDISMLKLKHVKEKHIEVFDFKNSHKSEVIRWVARSTEFNDLLQRLQTKYNLGPEDYLIEPRDNRRNTLSNHASKAFTHYWANLETGYYARMYTLRDTHITLMIKRYGNSYQGVFGAHQNIDTSLRNYASYEEMISQFSDKSMLA
jgi:integrase